ncbi:MAG: hypothetical protein PHU26_02255 [Methanofollis liminatans]|nr:hypothetical protein [Methanofollis liminatans]
MITTDPGASAVNKPVWFTVPTDGSLLFQAKTTSGTTVPEESYAAAENDSTSFTVISADAGVTLTHATVCWTGIAVELSSPGAVAFKGESTWSVPDRFVPETFSAHAGTTQSAKRMKIVRLSNTKE